MQLKTLYITRSEYGSDKGTLSGRVSFTSGMGEVGVNIDEQACHSILNICAEGMARATSEIGRAMTADILNAAAIEDKREEDDA